MSLQTNVPGSSSSGFIPSTLTAGSVVFSDGTQLNQNNASFFWDNANLRLVATGGTGNSQIRAAFDGSNYVDFRSGAGGGLIITPTAASLSVTIGAASITATGAPRFGLNGTNPTMGFYESGAAANNHLWEFEAGATTQVFRGLVSDDAAGTLTPWLRVTRSGTTISSVEFPNSSVFVESQAVGGAPRLQVKSFDQTGSAGLSIFHTGSVTNREYLIKTDTNAPDTLRIGEGTGNGSIATNWLVWSNTQQTTSIYFGATETVFLTGTAGSELVNRFNSDSTGLVCAMELYRTVDNIENPANWERIQFITQQIVANCHTIRSDSGGTGTLRDLTFHMGSTEVFRLQATGTNAKFAQQLIHATGSVGTPSSAFAVNASQGFWGFNSTNIGVSNGTTTGIGFNTAAAGAARGIRLSSDSFINWFDTTDLATAANNDTYLKRHAAGVVQVGTASNGAYIGYDGTNVEILPTAGQLYFASGALATNATTGFMCIPSGAGAPTGVPASIPTGQVPIYFDNVNNFLYVYVGGWKKSTVYS